MIEAGTCGRPCLLSPGRTSSSGSTYRNRFPQLDGDVPPMPMADLATRRAALK
jgi:hypothetical protein